MKEDEVVKILIEDIEVEGRSSRSLGDYGVAITKPYCNLFGGCHIPYFARGLYNYEGEYGDASIKATLKELYTMGKFLTKEMKSLKEKIKYYNDIDTKLSSEMIGEQEFNIKRLALKKRLKDGEITSKEYQKAFTPLRKEYEALGSKIHEQRYSFFKKNFPMIVPISNHEHVMDIIEGKISLTNSCSWQFLVIAPKCRLNRRIYIDFSYFFYGDWNETIE